MIYMGIIGDLDIKFLEDLEEEIFMLQNIFAPSLVFFPSRKSYSCFKILGSRL